MTSDASSQPLEPPVSEAAQESVEEHPLLDWLLRAGAELEAKVNVALEPIDGIADSIAVKLGQRPS